MSLKNQRTNEEIKKEFQNNFELANFAIDVAKAHLKTNDEIPPLAEILTEVLKKGRERNAAAEVIKEVSEKE